MKTHILLAISILVGVGTSSARAETAVSVPSCADAQVAKNWYDFCVWVNGPGYCSPPDISQCWDFESGFAPWSATGTAFANQPTYGDNVVAWRVLQSKASAATNGVTVLNEMESSIGGDYWQTAHPIGHQGQAWLGTYEDRPSPGAAWGGTQGDAPTGVAYSPQFVVDRDWVTFLVGGGCDYTNTRVELQVWQPEEWKCRPTLSGGMACLSLPARWETAVGALGLPLVSTGTCSEEMSRQSFYTGASSGLQGRTVRVAVTDNSSGPFGHINVDHVLHANTIPADTDGRNVPLWGIADTHAHVGAAETSMRAVSGMKWDGYVIHGSVGTDTTDRNILMGQLPSCDGRGHKTNTTALALFEKIETLSLGSSPGLPLGCIPPGTASSGTCSIPPAPVRFNKPPFDPTNWSISYEHWGQGIGPTGNDLVGWPYWYTRTHQQMHLTWIKRAYLGGQRLLVASAVNNELLGMAVRELHTGHYLSDYGALRRFAHYMKNLANANQAWMEIAYTPADARRIIRENRLAIVLATEVDDLGDHCAGDFTSAAADDPMDHAVTTTTEGRDPWNQERDRTAAASCKTEQEWTRRIDNLYKIGYRVVIPVHLADNDLGGTAVYSDLFAAFSRFMTGSFLGLMTAPDVTYLLTEKPGAPKHWNAVQAGWTRLGNLHRLPAYGPTITEAGPIVYPFPNPPGLAGPGFINARALTFNGLKVIEALKARGMIIDIAHLSQRGRERVLGLSGNETSSPLNPGCNMGTSLCQRTAYPVISSHAAFRELQPPRDVTGGGTDEGALRRDMIERIAAIGGTVAVGVSAADVLPADAADPGRTWDGILKSDVASSCGGSTRSFAQSYVYALRRMNGKGITLGTDFNGLEDRLNPRFGTQGCYARGNIPFSLQVSWDNSTTLVSHFSQVPVKFRPGILNSADGSAGLQRENERTMSRGLRYDFYTGVPSGGRYAALLDPPNYLAHLRKGEFDKVAPGIILPNSMFDLSSLPALRASRTGNRTFDFNYDGYAHYGMLPDMLQDARVVGMTNEQLSPLFQGAESFVQTWERGCRSSSPSQNALGCAGTPP